MNRIRKFVVAAMVLASAMLAAAGQAVAASELGPPAVRRAAPKRVPSPPQWLDNAHNHLRSYPATGARVPALPAHPLPLVWAGVSYWFWSGVWYTGVPGAYVVVRPPYGIVVSDLPVFRTAVVIGGISYLYLNGVYYRGRVEGGYEVVPSPVVGIAGGMPQRLYVYPARGQSAELQANDEYECHRWAVSQTGFDPVPAATGQNAEVARRADYVRAQTACLEGRGYTVR